MALELILRWHQRALWIQAPIPACASKVTLEPHAIIARDAAAP